MTAYDMVALGGGTAGLSVVRAAKREGARVAMITDGPIGGDCTFTGCVPSKTLIESSRQGLSFADSMARIEEVVAEIAATENADVLRGEGIDVIEGRGALTGPKQLQVDGKSVHAENIAICTGARAFVPPIDGLSEVDYLTDHDGLRDGRPGAGTRGARRVSSHRRGTGTIRGDPPPLQCGAVRSHGARWN